MSKFMVYAVFLVIIAIVGIVDWIVPFGFGESWFEIAQFILTVLMVLFGEAAE